MCKVEMKKHARIKKETRLHRSREEKPAKNVTLADLGLEDKSGSLSPPPVRNAYASRGTLKSLFRPC
jgi:hypothetical protein